MLIWTRGPLFVDGPSPDLAVFSSQWITSSWIQQQTDVLWRPVGCCCLFPCVHLLRLYFSYLLLASDTSSSNDAWGVIFLFCRHESPEFPVKTVFQNKHRSLNFWCRRNTGPVLFLMLLLFKMWTFLPLESSSLKMFQTSPKDPWAALGRTNPVWVCRQTKTHSYTSVHCCVEMVQRFCLLANTLHLTLFHCFILATPPSNNF